MASFTIPSFAVDTFQLPYDAVIFMIASDVEDLDIPAVPEIPVNFNHSIIDRTGTPASSCYEQGKFIRIQSQQSTPVVSRSSQDILAYRIACINQDIFSLKPVRCFFISQSDAFDKPA